MGHRNQLGLAVNPVTGAVWSNENGPNGEDEINIIQSGKQTCEIPGTGHLERIVLNDKQEELRRESMLMELRQRIRDVRQGPDGLLYLLTDEETGALLRIEPAQ